ncbi:hypothetical protein PoB_004367000 [Plakobranchus ocellatus]|uniref:Uncharacterized protein n=1 Tax=Plakobranchus ocellatus TaxID=259542 RepID=A0AAV4BCA4_9GAST|nr:hypothetical protein PoB_004367000 [Plakobranchus ocellatus]
MVISSFQATERFHVNSINAMKLKKGNKLGHLHDFFFKERKERHHPWRKYCRQQQSCIIHGRNIAESNRAASFMEGILQTATELHHPWRDIAESNRVISSMEGILQTATELHHPWREYCRK